MVPSLVESPDVPPLLLAEVLPLSAGSLAMVPPLDESPDVPLLLLAEVLPLLESLGVVSL